MCCVSYYAVSRYTWNTCCGWSHCNTTALLYFLWCILELCKWLSTTLEWPNCTATITDVLFHTLNFWSLLRVVCYTREGSPHNVCALLLVSGHWSYPCITIVGHVHYTVPKHSQALLQHHGRCLISSANLVFLINRVTSHPLYSHPQEAHWTTLTYSSSSSAPRERAKPHKYGIHTASSPSRVHTNHTWLYVKPG